MQALRVIFTPKFLVDKFVSLEDTPNAMRDMRCVHGEKDLGELCNFYGDERLFAFDFEGEVSILVC